MASPDKDLRIVLVGKTGSGKSSSGNTILRDVEFKQGISSKSVTRECKRHVAKVEGRSTSVVDTPGIFDTSISEDQLKKEVEKCVYLSVPGPHVFLLVIRLDVRFTEEEKNTVRWIQENFGKDAARYTIVLFTHADALKGTPVDEFVGEDNDLQALVNECGGGFHSFNNEELKNRSQVTELLEKIKKMVKRNGGEHYTSEMYKRAQENLRWEANKQKAKDYGRNALALLGGGALMGAAAVGGVTSAAVLAGVAAVGVVTSAAALAGVAAAAAAAVARQAGESLMGRSSVAALAGPASAAAPASASVAPLLRLAVALAGLAAVVALAVALTRA